MISVFVAKPFKFSPGDVIEDKSIHYRGIVKLFLNAEHKIYRVEMIAISIDSTAASPSVSVMT
jgi:hypothetical protein